MATITAALDDPKLFGPWFRGTSWHPWRTILKAAFGLPLSKTEARLFSTLAGGRRSPRRLVSELWVVAGRRSGKSITAALLAIWAACFRDYRMLLAPGERAVVMVIAVDRQQAQVRPR